ncbi:MAG TPA: dihydropteroate synthase [Lentisphaeria bacterium]|nr:MAG: dihydropteroate synthase [Lentisphaerae bacterium GWF2_50_93]HCE46416.1 dihydropteroate synthase [Lentisphaeria bacterium]
MKFRFKNRSIACTGKTQVIGIVNVTPDSFSDGEEYYSTDKAVKHAIELIEAGASIIDIGGESTRPGSEPVDVEEEIRRVLPVVCELRRERPDAVISVDTMKSEVAVKALEAGADIINDVSALRNSRDMAGVIAEHRAGVFLMHMRGTPKTMQAKLHYRNLIGEINSFLTDSIRRAVDAGINRENIAVDPGIGFGKNKEQNLQIISRIEKFRENGRPIVAGPSRKRFIGQILGGIPPEERAWGTAGSVAYLAMRKIDFVRVHDVKEMVQMLKVLSEINLLDVQFGL